MRARNATGVAFSFTAIEAEVELSPETDRSENTPGGSGARREPGRPNFSKKKKKETVAAGQATTINQNGERERVKHLEPFGFFSGREKSFGKNREGFPRGKI